MNTNQRATLTVVLVAAALVVGALLIGRSTTTPPAPDTAAAPVAVTVPVEVLVRADSHRLSHPPDGSVTFVEFLDFECEACRAAYPAVEQLRGEYGDRVAFVARYFPLPSHANAENAAIAVEAAAQQGAYEAMYDTMFATQTEWGERSESEAARFRGFAADLGLDLALYDAVVADPGTRDRVARDRADGLAAGVSGTPTFFVDGQRLNPTSVDDLRAALDAALAGR